MFCVVGAGHESRPIKLKSVMDGSVSSDIDRFVSCVTQGKGIEARGTVPLPPSS